MMAGRLDDHAGTTRRQSYRSNKRRQTIESPGLDPLAAPLGVHTGECELIDGKAGGIAVTTGARIAALVGPSQVLVSQTVRDLVAGSGLTFEPAGEHELKGVPDRWRLCAAT